ncbi:hypothetical protein B0A50_01832 [Salinomyces thailandicus]|uniref:Mechanosensitive ion channel protein n=1 Tax=Salinomyces thailandicus TaxID=706561 RepID=A0A4U0U9F1_9PEZI|nr:hypothetical protein B0A50_01832 [Salinomyces thailandica]
MTTPVDELPQPSYNQPAFTDTTNRQTSNERAPTLPSYNINNRNRSVSQENDRKSSDEEGTVVGDNGYDGHNENVPPHGRPRAGSHLTVKTQYDYHPGDPPSSLISPSQTREQNKRLDDDLAMLKIERQVSRIAEEELLAMTKTNNGSDGGDGMYTSRTRRVDESVDEFDIATNPVHEKTQVYKPIEHPASAFGKFVKKVHQSNVIVRWVTYIAPLVLILLIPLLLGALKFQRSVVGGVFLAWFMIWLEIVWLTLWAGRLLAKMLPWPIGLISTLFTNNSKKWRDMGKQLELPATLFFWWLAIEISFLPTMKNHQRDFSYSHTAEWMGTMNKVLVAILVGVILNFAEKIIIQLIAISFHLRTYADRIEINKFQIGSLAKLYKYSKEKIQMEDSEFEAPTRPGSGAITPGAIMTDAAKQTKQAFAKFGDVAGKVAGDFTGKKTTNSTHPNQVVLALLHSTTGSQVLARRLYRTFAREETQTVHSDDLRNAFENDEEAEAAFSMFDKDMNGDISMEELEAVCVEIGRERKSITASLKDLDSVVGKLDDVFMFLVAVITILVFISLISTSAAGVLTSAGSAVLALSWLFSATAQEFLQSVIFVFVKHPFDVGDRVGVYGNTGATGLGDDYFVKEISLLYTEFKKMEGQVVQAPNSYLNGLFILNQRRSGGQAEAVPVTIKFGTTLDQIEGLRNKLLDFVTAEKREYQGKILTELREVVDVHYMTLNVVFFYKSNWQNEGLRLARRNKFICALMVTIQEMGIEGPFMRFPGMKQSFPMYLQNVPHVTVPGVGHSGHPDHPTGYDPREFEQQQEVGQDPPFVTAPETGPPSAQQPPSSRMRSGSILRNPRTRGESLSAMNKRVDFSLGMKSMAAYDDMGDVYEDRNRNRIPINVSEASRSRERASREEQVRERNSQDVARTSSRDSHIGPGSLARRSTESHGGKSASGGSIHRNRFFSRSRPPGPDEAGLMEGGMMADIPENPSGSGHASPGRTLDPRSGLVSPAAWRMNTTDSSLPSVPSDPSASGALGGAPDGHRPPRRAATENYEMRRI